MKLFVVYNVIELWGCSQKTSKVSEEKGQIVKS